jgi:glycosyltransferase involved in cell wall biosynthesis
MFAVETHQPTISIVVPAFNESGRLGASLVQVCDFVRRAPLAFEVIIVDDGSTDGTADIVRRFEGDGIRLIQNRENRGKGYSVRNGVLNATGTYVLFTDADLSTPIDELNRLYDIASRDGVDIVIGSRAIDRRYIERHQPRVRELGGIVFNRIVRMVLRLDVYDTQCGFKLFHRDRTRLIFEQLRTERFAFDPEILFLSARRGLSMREVPVRWRHSDETKVRIVREGLRTLADLVRIRWNYSARRYGTPRAAP